MPEAKISEQIAVRRSEPGHRNPKMTGAQRLFSIFSSCDSKGGGVTKRGAHPTYQQSACVRGLKSAFGVSKLSGMMEGALRTIGAILLVVFSSALLRAEEPPTRCIAQVSLSQSRVSLNLWAHLKDAMNTVEFKLPLDCVYAKTLKPGENLVPDSFRGGSALISGSWSNWNLKVIKTWEEPRR